MSASHTIPRIPPGITADSVPDSSVSDISRSPNKAAQGSNYDSPNNSYDTSVPSIEDDGDLFPRSSWTDNAFPPVPFGNSSNLVGRTNWAARNASRLLAAALSPDGDIGDIDALMFKLACFDKVYEINSGEWHDRLINRRRFAKKSMWMEHVDDMIHQVYDMASSTLSMAGRRSPPASEHDVRDFCRMLMARCADALYDGKINDYQAKTYTPAAFGRFDPDLMNKAEVADYVTTMFKMHDVGGGHYVVDTIYVEEDPTDIRRPTEV
ncbi:hypothetical protein CC85DRAFT_287668 [Cutaneotrichosporon oleaginosum]|uniref:Uncharacterized protein n=1 Tax=Cutaneotrichosporon oleaginosum TaxID=879819 RepID=A0A0J1AY46_9TREE|nr:uncharacterized protein CC85DRAFT_287668 [Cutaneotrichosporon oleaginosum]KLT40254.1 hypothetical protein CC85DRAFT_287668 [Cutaneotrichosporon oleaginosum]TXT11297.1 hypothetical protein COLE_01707 [Cutaneotrichosporon oleaginosum]